MKCKLREKSHCQVLHFYATSFKASKLIDNVFIILLTISYLQWYHNIETVINENMKIIHLQTPNAIFQKSCLLLPKHVVTSLQLWIKPRVQFLTSTFIEGPILHVGVQCLRNYPKLSQDGIIKQAFNPYHWHHNLFICKQC